MNEIVRTAANPATEVSANAEAADELTAPVLLTPPASQENVLYLRQPDQLVDLRLLQDLELSFFRIGDALEIIFADGGILIVQDYFVGGGGQNIAILRGGQVLTLDQFIVVAAPKEADEIQTASGETVNLGTALDGPTGSGQSFQDVVVTEIGGADFGTGSLDLLDNDAGDTPGFSGGSDRQIDPKNGTPTATEIALSMSENDDMLLTIEQGTHFDFGADAGPSASLVLGFVSIEDAPANMVPVMPPITLGRVVDGYRLSMTAGTAFDGMGEGDTMVMTIPYTVTDADGDTATGLISITVTGTNDAPVITAGVLTGAVKEPGEDSGKDSRGEAATSASGTLQASDVDHDANLEWSGDSDGVYGTFQVDEDTGTWTYTIDDQREATQGLKEGEERSETFTVTVSDGEGGTDQVDITITVTGTNDRPVAQGDSFLVFEDQTLDIDVQAGVIANDTDVDGDGLTAVLVTDVQNGSLTLNSDGSFSYTPNANFSGTDSFTYKVNDGTADSEAVTVTLTVDPVNDAPVAQGDSYTVDEDQTLTVAAQEGVIDSNDTDVDGDDLTAVLVTDVKNGSLTLNSDGSFSYTPNANFSGTDSFTYKVNDGTADSEAVTVTLTVDPVDDAPVAQGDSYTVDEDQTLTVAAQEGVIANDTDVDGDDLTAVLVTDVKNGSLTLNSDGSFSYTPNANFSGTDSFTYKVNDGTADSEAVTVTLTVDPVNDAPTAVDDVATTDEDTVKDVSADQGLLANDSDLDGDTLEITSFTFGGTTYAAGQTAISSSGEKLTVNADGSYIYDPTASVKMQRMAEGDSEATVFKYTIADGHGGTAEAEMTMTVTGQTEGVVRLGDEFRINEHGEGDQSEPQVTLLTLTDGRVLATYTTEDGAEGDNANGTGISGRIGEVQENGDVIWGQEFRINEGTARDQNESQVTLLEDGRIFITYASENIDPLLGGGLGYGVAGRIGTFDENGNLNLGGEFALHEHTRFAQTEPQVTQIDQNRIFVTFTTENNTTGDEGSGFFGDAEGTGIGGRIGTIQDNGTVTWGSEFRINANVEDDQSESQVTMLADGRVFVAFTSADAPGDGAGTGISGRIGTINGTSVAWGGEFRINQNTAGDQSEAQVTLLADGRVFVTFTSGAAPGDGSGTGISGRIGTVNADGSVTFENEFAVNENVSSNQVEPQVTQLADGRILVVFASENAPGDGSSYGISGRVGTLQNDGSVAFGPEFLINENVSSAQGEPQITELDDGRVLVSFTSGDSDGDGTGISGRIIDLDGVGTDEADTLVAVSGAGETLLGLGGNDSLTGGDHDDTLIGGLGVDTLTGGSGADTFVMTSLAEADLITDYSDGDKLDLGQLLDGAFGAVVDARQSGNDVVVRVDLDGDGADHDWQDVAILQNSPNSIGDTIQIVMDTDVVVDVTVGAAA